MVSKNSKSRPFRRLRYRIELAFEDLDADPRHLRYGVGHGNISVVRDNVAIFIIHQDLCKLEVSYSIQKKRRRPSALD